MLPCFDFCFGAAKTIGLMVRPVFTPLNESPVFTSLDGASIYPAWRRPARAVSARKAQGDAQAVGVVFSGGTAAVAVHGFGNQCQAEAAVFFAVQGVVALKEARQGVVGDGGCGAVVQTEGGVAAALYDGEGEGAAFRGGADGVFQQVGEGLFEPEGISAKGKRWFEGSVGSDGLVRCRGLFLSPPVFFWKSGFSRSVCVVHWRINSLFFAAPTPVLPAGYPRGKRPRGRGFFFRDVFVEAEVFLCESRLLGMHKFVPEGGDIKRLFVERVFFKA